MTVPRAMTWSHLLPSGAAMVCTNAPAWFRELVEPSEAGDLPVRVCWHDLPDLKQVARSRGVVAINCPAAGRRLQELGFSHVRRFAAVPTLEHARWFIPLEDPAVSAGAFCMYTPLRRSAQMKHLAVRIAARTGLPIWYRDEICIAQREAPPLERAVRQLFPNQPVHLALSSGATGPELRRKASAAVLDGQGRAMAFVKLARGGVPRRLLEHEARILPALAQRAEAARLAPRLLFSGDVDGTFITIQSPVAGRAVATHLTPAHYRSLRLLQSENRKPAASTELVQSLQSRLESAPALHEPLSRILHELMPTLGDTIIPSTIVHTDFVPWNLRRQGDVVVAFDWDAAELDGIPLYDQQHHELVLGYLMKRWSVDQAMQRMEQLRQSSPLELAPHQMRALQGVHLLHLLLRLMNHGHGEGHRMIIWYQQLLYRLVGQAKEAMAV